MSLRGFWPGLLTTSLKERNVKSEHLLSQPLPVTCLLNLDQHHSSGSRMLSPPFICRLYSLRLGFLYRNRSSFTPAAKLTLIQMTSLPMLDYGDLIYRLAGKGALERIDVLYHSAIRFVTNAPYRTHHCTLYSSVNWSSLYTCRKTHWLMLIYKTLLGLTPPIRDIYCSPHPPDTTPVLPVTSC